MNIFEMFKLFDEGEIDLDDLAKLIKRTVQLQECSWDKDANDGRGRYKVTMGQAAHLACEHFEIKDHVFKRVHDMIIDLIENHYEESFYFCEKQLARDIYGRRVKVKEKPDSKKPEAFTCSFQVQEFHSPNAGVHFFGDKVAIAVESGDPGGESGEFTEYMRKVLTDWYNGKVDIIKKENS